MYQWEDPSTLDNLSEGAKQELIDMIDACELLLLQLEKKSGTPASRRGIIGLALTTGFLYATGKPTIPMPSRDSIC